MYYLKSNDYKNYIELLNQFRIYIRVDQVHQLNSILNNHPSYLKIITIVNLSPSINDFELSKFNLNIEDILIILQIYTLKKKDELILKYLQNYLSYFKVDQSS